jgi:ABC-type multidrug transport system fused ATPase/permease subunit
VLCGVTFSIEEKTHVALAGPSGCGKTTIVSLILRLFDPWGGEILIDDYNIKDLKFASLRGNLGVALQKPLLWNDSVKNNIRYACANAAEAQIKRVAAICLVDRFLEHLPDGYDTVIGEGACRISEGQKQKIAIARALIKNPKILILDEAMSSMDSSSEEEIMYTIKKEYPGLTILSVSHRLSTVVACDSVYFLKDARQMLVDSPRRLIENNDAFRSLFATQHK